MSGLLAGKVWQSNLDGTLKPLAACLADIASHDGSRIFPSIEYICWLTGKSPRAVHYQLRKLETMGVLDVVAEPTGRVGEYKEYSMNEDKLPKRPKWKPPAKIARGNRVQFPTEPPAISDEPPAISDISPYRDPSLDPLETRKAGKQLKPTRTEVEVTLPFNSPEYREAWNLFAAVRQELKSPLGPTQIAFLLEQLAMVTETQGIQILTKTARKNYRNFDWHFEAKNSNGNGNRNAQPVSIGLRRGKNE